MNKMLEKSGNLYTGIKLESLVYEKTALNKIFIVIEIYRCRLTAIK